jgi:hypothetical protein
MIDVSSGFWTLEADSRRLPAAKIAIFFDPATSRARIARGDYAIDSMTCHPPGEKLPLTVLQRDRSVPPRIPMPEPSRMVYTPGTLFPPGRRAHDSTIQSLCISMAWDGY